jgi:hypothetical protein
MKKGKRRDLRPRVEAGKFEKAYLFISKSFASRFRNTYLRGKTDFRDFLYDKMGCSLLEAEMLVDALEKNQKIKFERLGKGMRYGEWVIR